MKKLKTSAARRASQKRWKDKNREAMKMYYRNWYEKNREKRLEYHTKYNEKYFAVEKNMKAARVRAKRNYRLNGGAPGRYGLTQADVDKIFVAQNGVCAICKGTKPLCIDHDHKTKRVRGLLCRTCNLGIGHLNDDLIVILQAADYLRRYYLPDTGDENGV